MCPRYYSPEPPNLTNPVEVLENIKNKDPDQTIVNLNNVEVPENTMIEIFDALRGDEVHESPPTLTPTLTPTLPPTLQVLSTLSVANTALTDWAAANLAHTLECNGFLESVNIESNNVTPQGLTKLFEALNVQESVTELKAMNQAAQVTILCYFYY